MKVQIYKNFLSVEECELLNNSALHNIDEWFGKSVSPIKNRLTTRFVMKDKGYTPEVIEIADKVRKHVGVENFPIIKGHGSDGIVATITYQGGSVHSHLDPRSDDGLPTYRCNVLTQANEDGAELYVSGEKINLEVGDLHCYMVSELEHYVTEAKGPTPRIMWLFGAHIPRKYWGEYGLS